MRKKITLFLFSISLALTSSAQNVSSKNDTGKLNFGDQNNFPNAVTHAGIAIFSSLKESNVTKDSISGMCTLNGSTCNGAEIVLYRKKDRIYQTTLTSMGTFKIPNLKSSESYLLELTWVSKNLSKTKSVEAGEYVEIKLTNE